MSNAVKRHVAQAILAAAVAVVLVIVAGAMPPGEPPFRQPSWRQR